MTLYKTKSGNLAWGGYLITPEGAEIDLTDEQEKSLLAVESVEVTKGAAVKPEDKSKK